MNMGTMFLKRRHGINHNEQRCTMSMQYVYCSLGRFWYWLVDYTILFRYLHRATNVCTIDGLIQVMADSI